MFSLFKKKETPLVEMHSPELTYKYKEEIINYFSHHNVMWRTFGIHSVTAIPHSDRIILRIELSYPGLLIGKQGAMIKGLGAYLKSRVHAGTHIDLVEKNPFLGVEAKTW